MSSQPVAPEALEAHRAALTGHCYRMLGSISDADDAVQETMVRAWRKLEGFEGRSSLRTWLHRIATNVCLDALAERSRRVRPTETRGPGTVDDALVAEPRSHWLEPVPDARVVPEGANPAEAALLREQVRLAFVAALQYLPPRQRAVLLLADVLEWSAAEIAEALETSVPAVNSALQRARAALSSRPRDTVPPLDEARSALLEKFVDAFQRYDVDALATLLREDVKFSMPPYALWLEGPAAVRAWLLGRGGKCRGSRLLPTRASGSEAFAQYRPHPDGIYRPWALVLLETSGDEIAAWTSFLDVEHLFPQFELPLELRS